MQEKVKEKEELDELKKAKGLDLKLILTFFALSVIASVLYTFCLVVSAI